MFLNAGETTSVTFALQAYQLSTVINNGMRLVPPGRKWALNILMSWDINQTDFLREKREHA